MIDGSALEVAVEMLVKPENLGELMGGFFRSKEFQKARNDFSFTNPNNPLENRHKAPIGEKWDEMSEEERFGFDAELEDAFFEGSEPATAFAEYTKGVDYSRLQLGENENWLIEEIQKLKKTSSDDGGDKPAFHESVGNVLGEYVNRTSQTDSDAFKRLFGGSKNLAKLVGCCMAVSRGVLGNEDVRVLTTPMAQLKPANKEGF